MILELLNNYKKLKNLLQRYCQQKEAYFLRINGWTSQDLMVTVLVREYYNGGAVTVEKVMTIPIEEIENASKAI